MLTILRLVSSSLEELFFSAATFPCLHWYCLDRGDDGVVVRVPQGGADHEPRHAEPGADGANPEEALQEGAALHNVPT